LGKITQQPVISGGVVILSLIAAWLFDGSGRIEPPPAAPPAPQTGIALPPVVSVTPLTAPKPPPPDVAEASLVWLAKTQHPDGHWDLSAAQTGLALIAFLSKGQTHKHGKHKRTIREGLKFLKQVQHPDGFYVGPNQARSNRGHAIATLAMAEAYALTASPLFKQSAQQAVDALNTLEGLDLETTAWACIALRQADRAGLRAEGSISSHTSACRSPSECHLCRAWDPASTLDPIAHYFGAWRAYADGPETDVIWRRDLALLSASLQRKDGSYDPAGPQAALLGRTGTTALMVAATAMTFWSPDRRIR
jgi:hypothetical protein